MGRAVELWPMEPVRWVHTRFLDGRPRSHQHVVSIGPHPRRWVRTCCGTIFCTASFKTALAPKVTVRPLEGQTICPQCLARLEQRVKT